MPANTDYSKGKIYKLTSPHIDSVYVGSTVQALVARKSRHKSSHRLHLAGKGGKCKSAHLLALGEVEIELLEAFPCSSDAELDVREGMWLRKLRAEGVVCVNTRMPGAHAAAGGKLAYQAAYHVANKAVIAARMVAYYAANKKAIAAKRGVKHDCECGGKYTTSSVSTHRKTKRHLAWAAEQV